MWLLQGSERFASDPEVSEVLIKAAREKDTRRCFLLLGAILDTPGLADRLLEALQPEHGGRSDPRQRGEATHMTWADFYLICFAVGFCFSLLSFLPEACAGICTCLIFHTCMRPRPSGRCGHGAPPAHGQGATAGAARDSHGHGAHVSPFNFVTLTAFLAWFGGAGYLLTRFSGVWFVTGLGLAVVSGLVGGALYFFFSAAC